MPSLGTSTGVLEIAKFAVYVTVPIGLMYFFANNTQNLQKFMGAEDVFELIGVPLVKSALAGYNTSISGLAASQRKLITSVSLDQRMKLWR